MAISTIERQATHEVSSIGDCAAYGANLYRYKWTHFITVTTKRPISPGLLCVEFRRAMDRLASYSKGSVRYFYSIEPSQPGHWHIHALVWVARPTPDEKLARAWKRGWWHVRRYDPTAPGCYYVVKWLRQDLYDSSKMPPTFWPAGPLAALAPDDAAEMIRRMRAKSDRGNSQPRISQIHSNN